MCFERFLILLAVLSLTQCGMAQTTITGKADAYSGGDGKLLSNPGLSEPVEIGDIKPSGEFSAEVGSDYFKRVYKQLTDYHKKHPGSRTMETFKEKFSCRQDGNIKFTNGDQPIVNLIGMKGFMISENKNFNPVGFLMILSNEDFESSRLFHYRKKPKKGFMVDYYYVKKPLKAKGTCVFENRNEPENRKLENKRMLDLNLKKGWNMVKVEVTEVYRDKAGKFHLTGMSVKSIDEVPEAASFFFFKN